MPGRSAILGLIGAALGVGGGCRRQAALDVWQIAVARWLPARRCGISTLPSGATARIKRPNSRREALPPAPEDNPILTNP